MRLVRIGEVADRWSGSLKILQRRRRVQLPGDNCSNGLVGLGGRRAADFRPNSSKGYGISDGEKVKLRSLPSSSSMFVRTFSSVSADVAVSVGTDAPPPGTQTSRRSPPSLLLSDGDDSSQSYCFYSLSEKNTFTIEKNRTWRKDVLSGAKWVGSSHGWVGFINPRDCNLYLSNPSSPTSPIIPLPPVETLPSVIARFFRRKSLETLADNNNGTLFDFYFTLRNHKSPGPSSVPASELSKDFIDKVAMSSSPPSPSTTLAIIYGYNKSRESRRELAICRLGDPIWTSLDVGPYDDILFQEQKQSDDDPLVLYALKTCGTTEAWELGSSPPKKRLLKSFPPALSYSFPSLCIGKASLVMSSSGHLLAVTRYLGTPAYRTNGFDVHRLDLVDKKWVTVECLADEALFVGAGNDSMSLSARDFPELVPNSIYFTDMVIFDGDKEGERPSIGVFSLDDKTINLFDNLCLSSLEKDEEKKQQTKQWPVWLSPIPW